jgi:hypothetical protein
MMRVGFAHRPQVCTKDNMGEYGIKGIADAKPGEEEKLLNGPGLPRT